MDIAALTACNGSFSKELPGLQTTIDSTSLGLFKECPRKYFYSIILGLQPTNQSVHLTFGSLLHKGRENYDKSRAAGNGHEEALQEVIWEALLSTWDAEKGRGWASGDPNKNRLTLIRTLVWYLDEVAQNDPAETLILANGRPAVELTFSFHAGLRADTTTGEAIFLSGHLDRIAVLADTPYVFDIKTTSSALGPSWLNQFSPDNQFSIYTIAGKVAFDRPLGGVIVDGVQVGATFSRHYRGLIPRTPDQDKEWLQGFGYWFRQMEAAAQEESWPQNEKSCGHFAGCVFRKVCGMTPGAREVWLKADFEKRVWDPTVER